MPDATDRRILDILMGNGRVTWSQLASDIGLSPPSVAERVRKLEEAGIIEGYTAKVNPRALGHSVLAFVAISVAEPMDHEAIVEWVRRTPAVQECHVIAGDHDYLMKVRVPDAEHLEHFLRRDLRSIRGVARTTTTVVLHSAKETTAIPVTPAD